MKNYLLDLKECINDCRVKIELTSGVLARDSSLTLNRKKCLTKISLSYNALFNIKIIKSAEQL